MIQSYQRRFNHFTLAYKAALGAIAILCLTSAIIVDRACRPRLTNANIINIAGEQRLAASQSVHSIEDLTDPQLDKEDRDEACVSLSHTLAEWRSVQNLLLNIAANENRPELASSVRSAGGVFATIEESARRVLAGKAPEHDVAEDHAQLRRYLNAQDIVIRYLLDYHVEKINRLDQIQLTCAFLIILLLIAEAIWLYKPLLRGLQESFEQIEEHHAELEAVRNQLADQNESLRENENSINHALARAEDMSRLSRYSAARFEELFAGLPIATFTFDSEGTIFEWNRESEALFGIKAHRVTGRTLDHAPSRPVSPELYWEMIAKVFRGEPQYDLEQTIRRSDGDERIVLCNAFPFRGPDGAITGGVCVMLDVTETRREAKRIAESETLFRTSLESLQSGIVFMDKKLVVTKCNPRAAEIIGLHVEDVLGPLAEVASQVYIHEDGTPMVFDELPLLVAFRTQRPVIDSIVGIRREDGFETWISVNAAPVQISGDSEPIGAVCSFTDITVFREQRELILRQMEKTSEQAAVLENRSRELERANTKLAALATTDGLTNLNNHRHFQEAFEQAHALGQRSKRPLSLIMLDVDHFKRFNDVYGHPAGDEVLRKVAKALESVARDSDIVARYGGEEFVVILPDTDEVGAMEAAERFRKVIENQEWQHHPVTASFGVATTIPNEFDREQLLALADAALYASKKLGRNCSTHAESLRSVA